MNTPRKGPNPHAGIFTPSSLGLPSSGPNLLTGPCTPVRAAQILQPISSSCQIDWSYENFGVRDDLARRINSFSEPNGRQSLSVEGARPKDQVSGNWFSSPRNNGRKSMLDDPRSRGSPLKSAQDDTTSSRRKCYGKKRTEAYPCVRTERARTMSALSSEPSLHPGAWNSGSTHFSDNHIPCRNIAFVNRLAAESEAFTPGLSQEHAHTTVTRDHPQVYHQAYPFDVNAPGSSPSMPFHNSNHSLGPFFPSHSSSSNQPFHKAQESFQVENTDAIPQANYFEPYASTSATPAHTTPQPQVNPYAQDTSSLAGPTYYQGSGNYTQHQVLGHLPITTLSLLINSRSNTTSMLHSDLTESSSLISGPQRTISSPRIYVRAFSSDQKRL